MFIKEEVFHKKSVNTFWSKMNKGPLDEESPSREHFGTESCRWENKTKQTKENATKQNKAMENELRDGTYRRSDIILTITLLPGFLSGPCQAEGWPTSFVRSERTVTSWQMNTYGVFLHISPSMR